MTPSRRTCDRCGGNGVEPEHQNLDGDAECIACDGFGYVPEHGYAPVGAIVYCAYWQEHYTVRSHNDDGTVTVHWHGDARCRETVPRDTTHRTPLDARDRVLVVPDLSVDLFKAIFRQEQLRSSLRSLMLAVSDAERHLTPGMKAGVAEAKGKLNAAWDRASKDVAS